MEIDKQNRRRGTLLHNAGHRRTSGLLLPTLSNNLLAILRQFPGQSRLSELHLDCITGVECLPASHISGATAGEEPSALFEHRLDIVLHLDRDRVRYTAWHETRSLLQRYHAQQ